ncbi:hypothetical protein [Paraliobacillus sp. JSM ZJ581]|uniref:hypothetical protein n=1 Tax=Paraliobacillus sp. JSM ZJ581 TaxID=3342118 RepID=UPI0035A97D8C
MIEPAGDVVVVEKERVAGKIEVCVEIDAIEKYGKKHSIHSFIKKCDKESGV